MKSEITLGMFALKPSQQLRGQGLNKETLRIIDGIEESRQWLYLHKYISTRENDRIVKKLFEKIRKEVKKANASLKSK
ncbi:MAG: hypothetical protein M0P12_11600 [Paludibacteraceae bacterium]|nr:hypothetical protein [Paludibacteraceae bacterium]MCK9616027.1 hypothetical protein [Candidatus Omnitrophota bacterium]